MTLPPNTYGVRCEFNPGGTPYTYLVDLLHHGEIVTGDHVVVASPKGGYKVIYVVGRADDLAPVDLKYMKYVVQKVSTDYYDVLMHNLAAGDEEVTPPAGRPFETRDAPPTSPLIDEGDAGVMPPPKEILKTAMDVDEDNDPGAPPKHHLDDLGGFE